MNHSLVAADRTTHLKIVVVALIASITVIAVRMSARPTETGTTVAGIEADQPVIKASKPLTFTGHYGSNRGSME
jgi:hypothetical protein